MNKNYFILIIIFLSGSVKLNAQSYPFYDDFESYSAFQVPSAYPGNIQVRLVHGTNSSKGLGSFMNTFTTKDSATSPSIGPLTTSSGLSFDWRIVGTIGSVFVPANLAAGDLFTTSITTDGINYLEILRIDNSNYIPSSDFNHFTFDLAPMATSNINVKFTISRLGNPEDFYVDIDNLSISDTSLNTSIGQSKFSDFKIYPNPASSRLLFQADVRFDKSKSVSISDEKGVEVQVLHPSELKENYIDVSSLKTGLYYLNIEGLNAVPFLKY